VRLNSLVLSLAACLFLAFGLYLMISAYYQTHPTVFLALFFSASLIILLSAALLLGLIWRYFSLKKERNNPDSSSG